MIEIKYNINSYAEILNQLALALGTTVTDNKVIIPREYGQGYFKLVPIETGDLEALVYNVKLTQDLVLKRGRREEEFYTLVFDEVDKKAGFSISIGTEKLHEELERPAFLYLTSFLFDVETVLEKNVTARGIRTFMSEKWMRTHLQLNEKDSVLETYINMKTAGVMFKPVDEELKQLLNELMAENLAPFFYTMKILHIAELFFAWLYDEMQVISDKNGISRHDIEMAQKVESILTTDITKLPPTIKEMSKEVAMSESKLKKIFKAVYGLPPYEYYQKQRMQAAKLMLTSGDYSIKDVGYTLGYSNLSNFTLAFKKVFGKLPSQVTRSVVK